MNIVHLCLANHFSDGYGYQENLLSKYHKKMGLNVIVLTSQWTFDDRGELVKCNECDYVNEDGVRVVRLPIVRGTSENRLKRYKNLIPILDNLEPDIIFIHCPQFLNLLTVGRYLRKHSNVIAYVDNHSDYSNSARSWISKNVQHKILWRLCIRRVKRNVKMFYGVLPARVDFMKELYGLNDSQCELLVMGGDDELVAEAENQENIEKIRKNYAIKPEDFLIVTGGKIDAYKKQTVFLMEAVRRIESERVKLIVFGSLADEFKNKVDELADGKKIHYIGWIDTNDSYNYFAAAELVVFPGRHSVFWEQVVAQGKPMVVKDWAGTQHVDLEGNIIFLENDSVEEIEGVLRTLIEPGCGRYEKLKKCAECERRKEFLYSTIAKRSIGMDDNEGSVC